MFRIKNRPIRYYFKMVVIGWIFGTLKSLELGILSG
jgi:hypothetical protein